MHIHIHIRQMCSIKWRSFLHPKRPLLRALRIMMILQRTRRCHTHTLSISLSLFLAQSLSQTHAHTKCLHAHASTPTEQNTSFVFLKFKGKNCKKSKVKFHVCRYMYSSFEDAKCAVSLYTHAHTHSHTNSHTHTHTRTYTYTRTLTHSHTRPRTCALSGEFFFSIHTQRLITFLWIYMYIHWYTLILFEYIIDIVWLHQFCTSKLNKIFVDFK